MLARYGIDLRPAIRIYIYIARCEIRVSRTLGRNVSRGDVRQLEWIRTRPTLRPVHISCSARRTRKGNPLDSANKNRINGHVRNL